MEYLYVQLPLLVPDTLLSVDIRGDTSVCLHYYIKSIGTIIRNIALQIWTVIFIHEWCYSVYAEALN